MEPMACVIAKPSGLVFEGEVYYVGIPGIEGDYGVLPGHALTTTLNKQGGMLELHMDQEGNQVERFLIQGGASSIIEGKVTILARFCTKLENVDVAKVQKERESLVQQIAELGQDDDPQTKIRRQTLEKHLLWCDTRLNYAA